MEQVATSAGAPRSPVDDLDPGLLGALPPAPGFAPLSGGQNAALYAATWSTLPLDARCRLERRAADVGCEDVFELFDRLRMSLERAGYDKVSALHALATDTLDTDMASLVLALTNTAARRSPPWWPSHLSVSLQLDAATMDRLLHRAAAEALSGRPANDLAIMASCWLEETLANRGHFSNAARVADLIVRLPDADLRALWADLERARVSVRPS